MEVVAVRINTRLVSTILLIELFNKEPAALWTVLINRLKVTDKVTLWIICTTVEGFSSTLLLAFYKPLDMHLEDWLQIWYSNNIKSMPVRKLFSENAYEKALKAADLSGKKESGGKNPVRKEKAGGEKKKNRYVLVQ